MAAAALMLAGCVSTEMRRYVGQDISEVQMRYGAPANVIALPNGNRAYQFRSGGGSFVVPGSQQSTITTYGNTATVNTTGTPAYPIHAAGCLVTFIADPSGRVVDIRVPKGLVC